jgi:hypothetical protein
VLNSDAQRCFRCILLAIRKKVHCIVLNHDIGRWTYRSLSGLLNRLVMEMHLMVVRLSVTHLAHGSGLGSLLVGVLGMLVVYCMGYAIMLRALNSFAATMHCPAW